MTGERAAREERNDEIVRLYKVEHQTYEEIGEKFGVTREAIRLVLKKRGVVDRTAAREARSRSKSEASAATREVFDTELGPLIAALIEEDLDAEEIAGRLTAVVRAVAPEEVSEYARRHRLGLSRKPIDASFSLDAIRLALMTGAAAIADLPTSPHDALQLSNRELDELSLCLGASHPGRRRAQELAGAARLAGPDLTLNGTRYEEWRTAWLNEFPSKESARHPWPPTRATVIQKLGGGYWADAVLAAGLRPLGASRGRGNVVFTRDDYRQAMADFVADMAESGQSPSVPNYESWKVGRPVPSTAAIRKEFPGGWREAQRVGMQASGRRPELVQRSAGIPLSDQIIDRYLERSSSLWGAAATALDQSLDESPRGAANALVKEAVADATGDMVKQFEAFRRDWMIAAMAEDPSGFRTNLEPGGGATKAERLSWASLSQADITPRVIGDVVSDKNLDALLAGAHGLRNHGGWLAAGPESRLAAISDEDCGRWWLLKLARNVVEHDGSRNACTKLDEAFSALRPIHPVLLGTATTPNSVERCLQWLKASTGPAKTRLDQSRAADLRLATVRAAQSMRSTVRGRP